MASELPLLNVRVLAKVMALSLRVYPYILQLYGSYKGPLMAWRAA